MMAEMPSILHYTAACLRTAELEFRKDRPLGKKITVSQLFGALSEDFKQDFYNDMIFHQSDPRCAALFGDRSRWYQMRWCRTFSADRLFKAGSCMLRAKIGSYHEQPATLSMELTIPAHFKDVMIAPTTAGVKVTIDTVDLWLRSHGQPTVNEADTGKDGPVVTQKHRVAARITVKSPRSADSQ